MHLLFELGNTFEDESKVPKGYTPITVAKEFRLI